MKPKNVKVVWTSSGTVELTVSRKNLEPLKGFLSGYTEESKIVDEGDIIISYTEDGAVIECPCVDGEVVKKELVAMFTDKEGWTPHTLKGLRS